MEDVNEMKEAYQILESLENEVENVINPTGQLQDFIYESDEKQFGSTQKNFA